jgi:hypothetical protein
MRKPLYSITKKELWIRGVFVAVAAALVVAHD